MTHWLLIFTSHNDIFFLHVSSLFSPGVVSSGSLSDMMYRPTYVIASIQIIHHYTLYTRLNTTTPRRHHTTPPHTTPPHTTTARKQPLLNISRLIVRLAQVKCSNVSSLILLRKNIKLLFNIYQYSCRALNLFGMFIHALFEYLTK